jgi:SPW repeat
VERPQRARGIWLIISPFVLGYGSSDATWNPIVFGAIVGVLALVRFAGAFRAIDLSWLNMAIGVWLFISAFWLASSSQASWNVGILGVVVFVLGAWGAAPLGRSRTV